MSTAKRKRAGISNSIREYSSMEVETKRGRAKKVKGRKNDEVTDRAGIVYRELDITRPGSTRTTNSLTFKCFG